MKSALLALPLVALTLAPAAAQQTASPEEAELKAHIAYLSSDAMAGRAPFTPQYRTAADYVAKQFAAAGAVAGGEDDSFFQPVPLVRVVPDGRGTMELGRGGKTTALVFGEDFVSLGSPLPGKSAVTGDVVFAGYGVVDAGSGIDDYAGLDVSGRIVAVLGGAPKGLHSEVAAHFGSLQAKAMLAAARGAKGVLVLIPPAQEKKMSVSRLLAQWERGATTWAKDGVPATSTRDTPLVGFMGATGARKLFAGSPLDLEAIAAAAEAGTPVPRGPLGTSLSVAQKFTVQPLGTSDNVVGVIEGSDPALKDEYVVLSAHLDHIGVDEDAKPGADAINNGAMDNALGVGSLIEVAREFQRSGKRPRRSVMLLAVTAEEIGLLGSDYFARNPTVPRQSLVAEINLDMPVMTFDFVDLVALGGDRSSIGPVAAKVAGDLGFKLVPDPSPELAFFVRTDHYSFVKQGVPSISLDTGPGGPGQAAITDFLEKHYHQPSDEVGLIDMSAARDFVRVNYGIARAIADADARPVWNKGDFFGEMFGADAK
ncbi:M20/M25/M40 family metallo-hydrolase [Sphingomonas japonica]|uniref:Peptidase M28 domain-containing protein n=1 Tax=Sphingomonas japonica TaxID=511662 RepID=A0ABX0U365_9SPHN|nr:M20/M25/M40 family metallo-hydrolase [Sphingomonas japonica]NIJ23797.1 hypothetical protein [Sphingomonas japonica]